MDSLIEDFCRSVIDWRKTDVGRYKLLEVAQHLRSVVQPKLDELDTARARLAELEAENAALKKKKGLAA